jgi:uncharacterized membrane protein YoaK (UPF0700 family)
MQLAASSITATVMGVQAAVARSLAVTDMTTVVVTSTLTSLASESLIEGGVKGLWNRRFAAIGTLFAGALVGAALLVFGPAIPLALCAVVVAAVTVIGHRSLHVPADATAAEDPSPTQAPRRVG